MATLAELRSYVRVQTETTSAELPSPTIDSYIREAFNRTISSENRWPFYEHAWTLTQAIGADTLDIPVDLERSSIVSLSDDQNGGARLIMASYEAAEDNYRSNPSIAGPAHFSLWGDSIYLWPAVEYTVARTYGLRGYRKPLDWVSAGDAAVPDADERLHWCLAHYAVALAYIQQEDEVLEVTYMTRWQRDFEVARRAIMEPARNSPLQMGGGRWRWTR